MIPGRQAELVARIGDACVEPKGVACRRCSEACEPDAIRFRPLGGNRSGVRLDDERCTGCGECRAVCPVGAIDLIPFERLVLASALAQATRPA